MKYGQKSIHKTDKGNVAISSVAILLVSFRQWY